MHAAQVWQKRPRPPAGWQAAPSDTATSTLSIKQLCSTEAACQPPAKLAGWPAAWQAASHRSPHAERAGVAHEPPNGLTGRTRRHLPPLDARRLATREPNTIAIPPAQGTL